MDALNSGKKSPDKLKQENAQLRDNEHKLKQEVRILESKINDEQHKNFRIESILQLRAEYIKTLQDTDCISKAQITLLAKEVQELKIKLMKSKEFKLAKVEEVNNLMSTLEAQNMKINQLEHDIEQKDAKIQKYKSKLKEAQAEY